MPFACGETITPELANYKDDYTDANGSKDGYRQTTTPAGSFPANAWGLQDMHGNVWEWCLDHGHEDYKGAPIDGSAWLHSSSGEAVPRLLRGGSWRNYPGRCRTASRSHLYPYNANNYVGFRVVCLPS
jgi:formylglycine-generating enzyme required for sulfatase activity